jgi:hypothetical protein
MTRLLLLAGAACLAMVSIANAATVTIGLQQAGVNGGAITPVAGGVGSANIANLPYGTFTSNTVDGTGRPILPLPDILDSSSLNVTSDGPGTLRVYVTSQNNNDEVRAIQKHRLTEIGLRGTNYRNRGRLSRVVQAVERYPSY